MKRLMLGAVLLAAFASQVEAQEGDVAAGAAYAKRFAPPATPCCRTSRSLP